MKTSLMAAAIAAAILSAPVAMTADQNLRFPNAPRNTTLIKGHRSGDAARNTTAGPQQQAMPIAIKAMPIGFETGARRRAALATLLFIGAAAPCLRAEGKVLIASGGC